MCNIKIPWAKPTFYGKEKKYLKDALESTWISGGCYVDKFEKEFIRYNGSKYGITTSNGTTALQLAILALGIGSGDEVIVPGFSFAAPVNMIIKAGAIPVYADIDPQTWCINPKSVEKCITNRTKAVIAVHTYGNVCNMDALKNLSKKHKFYIIEDAAEAALSKYKGKYAGTFCDVGCFSFQATKTITMGEGGFVLTPSEELCKKMRLIRNHGMDKERHYWHNVIGYNFRVTNLQAAIGCGQLEYADRIISDRKRVYGLYSKYLSDEPGITLQNFKPEVEPVVWAAALKIEPKLFKGDRDFIINKLLKSGIETRTGFYPFSVMPLYKAPRLSISLDIGANVISLPTFNTLTGGKIAFICDRFKALRK